MSDHIDAIGFRMIGANLPIGFVQRAIQLSRQSEGITDVLCLWDSAPPEERDAIVAELYAMIEDREPSGPSLLVSSITDADAEIERRRALKEHLRKLVERHGGVSRIAAAAGIPQPSLSRLLNTMSEPRPATIARLARAMELPFEALDPRCGSPGEERARSEIERRR